MSECQHEPEAEPAARATSWLPTAGQSCYATCKHCGAPLRLPRNTQRVWSDLAREPQGIFIEAKAQTEGSVYSNFDHRLDAGVVEELRRDPSLVGQHAAWDFCGYIWFDGRWHEEVWRGNAPVERRSDPDLLSLIGSVNDDYGSD